MDYIKELLKLKKIPLYCESMQQLVLNNKDMSNEQKEFLLSCAIILLNNYSMDKRYKSFIELSYYIILKYSLIFQDYEPLYDFCVNLGFYPIAQVITNNNLLTFDNIQFSLLEKQINDKYARDSITETLQQKTTREIIINSDSKDISFIAPTSFGKSSIITDYLLNNNFKKAAIIVPTKSLLMQTFRSVKAINLNCKIIIHDEMYEGEDSFIAVLTQERALRLLEKYNIFFDIMFIDEAHNLLEKDQRSILLSRLIRLNKKRGTNSRTIYLSPLVSNSNNLSINKEQDIFEQKIDFNIKEPEYFEYRTDKRIYKYNRFLDTFYYINNSDNIFTYILSNKKNKNYCYLYSPKSIEKFAKEFAQHQSQIKKSKQIDIIIKNLKEYVHEDIFVIDYLKKGILYLHGKMPDNIKEYLEYKFATIPDIEFLIANKVILEGINLPIDCLFILNTFNLGGKELTNLIGRVNRLDKVFNPTNPDLNKLLPQVHFINSQYNRKNSKMENQIKNLKSSIFKDKLKNPLLSNFDFSQLDKPKREKDKLKCEEIIKNEEIALSDLTDPIEILMQRMIALGINNIIKLSYKVCKIISNRMSTLLSLPDIDNIHILDKLKNIFINDFEEYIIDDEFARLNNAKAISYYKMFFKNRQKTLKQKININIRYFKKKSESDDSLLYIGESYGETSYIKSPRKYYKKVYIDLKLKNYKELVNISIIKQKLEDDFVSFKLHMFFQLMADYELITKDEYNIFVFGTKDKKKLKLVKMGLTINIINRLEEDGQLNNINIDNNNNLIGNNSFKSYKNNVDDFYKFQLEKFIGN